MKTIRFTEHAKYEMKRRSIDTRWVVEAVSSPDEIQQVDIKRKIYQKMVLLSGTAYLLRVIIDWIENEMVVVTVYRTSKIEKYRGKV
ncbi:MAG: DUF4258 domain-containing protein [bacterium]|nr:DUF4258 domain-containing protein [bacterium]